MLINEEGLTDESKQQFLVLERWGGLDNAADYREQAQSLRRSMDSIEYAEKAYSQAIVAQLHKAVSYAGMASIVAVDDHEELQRHFRTNVAHARMSAQDREVIPLNNWSSGREELAALITQMETMAEVERAATARNELRPFDPDRES